MISHAPPGVLTSFGHALRAALRAHPLGGDREFLGHVRMGRWGDPLR